MATVNVKHGIFDLEITKDGSPTLRHRDHPQTESMHNPQGALSETLYIYGEALERAEARLIGAIEGTKLQVLVVGLGLGYLELMVGIKSQIRGFDYRIISFESEPELRQGFLSYIRGQEITNQDLEQGVPEGLVYQSFLEPLRAALGLDDAFCLQNLDKRLDLRSSFCLEALSKDEKFDLILYDPFSSKTNSELWEEEFLTQLLQRHSLPEAVFASFGATGNLNRALRASGYRREFRRGYGGKRESTLAQRK